MADPEISDWVCRNVRVEHPNGKETYLGDVHIEEIDARVLLAIRRAQESDKAG